MSDPAPPPTPGRDKIGVIVACHNQGRHVGEALASLDRQTHGNWEAVLVDDASTDATATAAKGQDEGLAQEERPRAAATDNREMAFFIEDVSFS